MTLNEFINKYDGKYVDWDKKFGAQCVDLYRQFCKEVLQVPQSPPVKGAADIWVNYLKDKFTAIKNTPTGIPKLGDLIIWGRTLNGYGHVAICYSANVWNFVSFDQNFPVGSPCHLQKHNYRHVIGWLRPIAQVLPTGTVTIARIGANLPPGEEFKTQVAHYTKNKLTVVLKDYNVSLNDAGMLTQDEAYDFLRKFQVGERFIQFYYQTPAGPFAVSYSFPEQKKYISTLPNNPPARSMAFELAHCLQYYLNDNFKAQIQVEDSMFPDDNFIQRKYDTVMKYLDKLE